ncbi:MAG: hypothetical protein Q3976_10540, partial [Corynebacterium sp.]|nr:hypothetical protein [Corynebacterium sp.]
MSDADRGEFLVASDVYTPRVDRKDVPIVTHPDHVLRTHDIATKRMSERVKKWRQVMALLGTVGCSARSDRLEIASILLG